MMGHARIGCAGWSIPKAHAAAFPTEGSTLERYAQVFDCVEVNSSFYRPHRPATWRRWAQSVPARFRFAAKIPRTISHECRLQDCDDRVAAFLGEVGELGDKLGWLLLQLPPSLRFDASVALPFLERLRRRHAGPLACEPRHPSWFRGGVDQALRGLGVARVAADPARVPRAAVPGGDRRQVYVRLHGSPRMYYDAYLRARSSVSPEPCIARQGRGASSTTRPLGMPAPTPWRCGGYCAEAQGLAPRLPFTCPCPARSQNVGRQDYR